MASDRIQIVDGKLFKLEKAKNIFFNSSITDFHNPEYSFKTYVFRIKLLWIFLLNLFTSLKLLKKISIFVTIQNMPSKTYLPLFDFPNVTIEYSFKTYVFPHKTIVNISI